MEKEELGIEELAVFCKRKGFVYPSGEIYGGLAGFWDFGPLGVELKNNIKKQWWNFHVTQRDDIAGIDGAIITNPKVWKASEHVDSFVDVAVYNKKTKEKFKADKHEAERYKGNKDYEIIEEFNPMFITDVGPIKKDSMVAYLRPETAQLIFADFKLVQENSRLGLPFGIAQVGKAFRNEISPRDFLFRCREFEQMEIEYFVNPEKKKECPYIKEYENFELNVYSEEMQNKGKKPEKMKVKDALKRGIIELPWHAYWLALDTEWFLNLGADKDKFRARQHLKDEKSHYAVDTWDLEYEFPFGWKELEGLANRGDFDLKQHAKFSGANLTMLNNKGEKILPEVICEPSLGVERAFLVFMFDSYSFDKKRNNIVLKLNPKLAPIKAAVFPIVKNPEMMKVAREICKELRKEWNVVYDETGSVGRRYSRQDEVGTPLCITIDEQSLKDKTATIRDRDSTKQVRVKIPELQEIVRKVISGENVLKLGKEVETRVK